VDRYASTSDAAGTSGADRDVAATPSQILRMHVIDAQRWLMAL
jgi:hypothetical protein